MGATGAALAVRRKANRHLPRQSEALKRHPNRRRRRPSCNATVRTINAAVPPPSPSSLRRRMYQRHLRTTVASAIARWSTLLPPRRRLVQQQQHQMNDQASVPGRLRLQLLSPLWHRLKLQLLQKLNRHRLKKNRKNQKTPRKMRMAMPFSRNLLQVVERRQLQ